MNKTVKAVFTLTIFSLTDRVLGFLFKIYLLREMGATNLGIYQVSISLFFVLIAITTSGLPLVTGKLTAAYIETGNKKSANSLISAGLMINMALSVIICAFVLIFQGVLRNMLASESSVYILLLILPAVFFASVGSVFRGGLWGKEQYFAVSVVELIEQITRIVLCITMMLVGINKLEAAAISLVIAMLLNALLCGIFYFTGGGRLGAPKNQLKPLVKTSAPISGLKASSSAIGSLAALAVPFLFMSSGYSSETALAYFGASMGMALPLMYLPITIVGSLAYTLIPTLSKALARGDKKEVKQQVDSAILFSIVAAAIFVPVFYALGYEVGAVLLDSAEAGRFLQMGAFLLIPISLESIVSSMMNSLGLERRGFVNYLLGSILMFGIMFCFYGNYSQDVLFWSLFASLVFSTVLDIIAVRKKSGASLQFIKTIIFTVALAVPTAFVCIWTYNLIGFMPDVLRIILVGIIGVVGYALLAIAFGVFDIGIILKGKSGKISKRKDKRKSIAKGLQN